MEPISRAYLHLLDDSPILNIKLKTHSIFPYTKYVDVKLDKETTQGVNINSLAAMHDVIFDQIPNDHIGVGGYLEERNIYHRGDTTGDYQVEREPRTVHLALDFWTSRIGTPVYSVLNGHIHSFSFNPTKGQFGGCVITEHNLFGEKIHLLYGHLSEKSLAKIKGGQKISAGELVGYIGSANENGIWPPHLHFQVIRDMQTFKGDYFGVAAKSQLSFFEWNCPDPHLILNIY